MQVFFDCSLWMEQGEEECSCIQPVNARFRAGGLDRVIPAVYCFKEGIVFDILTVMDERVMKDYRDRYAECEEKPEELSDARILEITQNNPYHNVDIACIWLNGCHETEDIAYSSTGCDPGYAGEIEKRVALKIKEAYPEYLENENCFFCQRVLMKTKEDWTKDVLTEIRVQTRGLRRTEVLDLEIKVKPGGEGRGTFVHPVTGARHEVGIYDIELAELPGIRPFYAGKAYVVPELSGEEHILFDSNLRFEDSGPDGCQEEGGLSVIGGSEGPAAVFIAAKRGGDGPVSVFLAGKTKVGESENGSQPVCCFSRPVRPGVEEHIVFRIIGLERVTAQEELIQVYQMR